MKLSPRGYEVLWDAHAWAGVLSSLVLFVTCFLGAFALFAEELAPWQEPAFRGPVAVDEARAVALAQQVAEAEAPKKPVWFGLSLPTAEEPWLRVWRLTPEGGIENSWLDPVSGQRLGERSDLGEFLNAMHFLEPLPGGKHVSGLASALLVLLVGTGLLLQLGRMARELVRFRPAGARRVLWSDAHKVVGVVTARFLLVFALTGGILWLGSWYEPAVVSEALGGDAAVREVAGDWPAPPAASGRPAPAPDLARALALARERFPGSEHSWFFLDNLGDASALVHLPGEAGGTLHAFTHVRVSRTGELVWAREAGGASAYSRILDPLFGLHFATWAGLPAKVLYALLSLLAAFGILAGNLLWLERRRARGASRFDAALARLTAGVCAGLALATAALFLANQLLPAGLADRPRWEHAAFHTTWALALLGALRARSAAAHARALLLAAGGVLLAVPLLDAARTGRLPFGAGSVHVLVTELGLVLLALLLLASARAIGRMRRAAPTPAVEAPEDGAPASP